MRRTLKNIVTAFAAAFLVILVFAGCSEASKVNYNISKQANYFESERRVTVYNARTDKVILEIEGYISISNNENNELIVTCKVGPRLYVIRR